LAPFFRNANYDALSLFCESFIYFNINILKILERITRNISHDNKLSDQEVSLRKALGYGWSVVIVSIPKNGKRHFEKLFHLPGKHVKWVIKENLKKNRFRMGEGMRDSSNNCDRFISIFHTSAHRFAAVLFTNRAHTRPSSQSAALVPDTCTALRSLQCRWRSEWEWERVSHQHDRRS
jgi:hypothetical protein